MIAEVIVLLLVAFITIFIITYRNANGKRIYKYISQQTGAIYDKVAPYSYKEMRKKIKDLGQDYTKKQYTAQVVIFAAASGLISYLYFYNLIISLIYAALATTSIPYLAYLRCKRLYSEYIFEQIQVYTTNTIMEFATTQSFVKALEGVYESGVLEDPVKSDVKMMIDMAYNNGTIEESIKYMNKQYDYFIVKNMHQLFLQITKEGSRDSGEALENMLLDIDQLVEGVYRDKMDRANFHKRFLTFGIALYLLVMLTQTLLGVENYISMLNKIYVVIILHLIIVVNSYFLLNGEKYYNEDTGGE